MNPLSSLALALSAALCASLVGCAGGVEPATPAVVRTPPPRNYEKTVTDYLAFKIRNPQKNAELAFGAPEPADCSLDISATSSRGWVVPVAYFTRSGEATGRETIRINTKQYYFWFLGNTIAGVTPRIELCPGVGASFEAPPAPAPAVVAPAALAAPASQAAEGAEAAKRSGANDRAKPASGAGKSTSSAKKSGASASKAPARKKKAPPGGKTEPS